MTLIEESEFSMETDLVFPNLQVCNANPMGLLRNVSHNETFEFYQKLVKNVTTCPACSAEDKELLSKLKEDFLSAYGYIAFVGAEKVLKLMKDYRDFLIECLVFTMDSYIGTDCETLADITIVPSFDYLLCLRLKFSDSDVIDKVSMTFYVDSFANEDFIEYNIWAMKSSGVAYSIYYANIDNIPYGPKPSAPPGAMTRVDINKEVYQRLSEPYGSCVETENYTFDGCFANCLAERLREYCHCFSPADFVTRADEAGGLYPCLSVSVPQRTLLQIQACSYATKRRISTECNAHCKQSCSDVRYLTEVSYTKWPLPHQYESFYDKLIKTTRFADKFETLHLEDSSDSVNRNDVLITLLRRQLVEDNFVKIDFVINNRDYQEFTEVPKYSPFSFLGTLGGALNLWTGITVVVVMEMIELILNIIRNATTGSQRKKNEEENNKY